MTTDSFLRQQARTQRFTLGTPREFRISPDGARVLFLRSASGTEQRNSLWCLDIESGRETRIVDPATLGEQDELTAAERAARERTRTQVGGIVGYTTDADCRLAVFSVSGRLFVVDLTGDHEVRELPVTGSVMDPRIDPTGRHVAYVAGSTLRVVEIDG
ncbi:MAG TPA: S9 family peptidase, partial [Pseudonocardiaceae bacterium]